MMLRRIFCRHDWRVVAIYPTPKAFAEYYGNAEAKCAKCGKRSIMYARGRTHA